MSGMLVHSSADADSDDDDDDHDDDDYDDYDGDGDDDDDDDSGPESQALNYCGGEYVVFIRILLELLYQSVTTCLTMLMLHSCSRACRPQFHPRKPLTRLC